MDVAVLVNSRHGVKNCIDNRDNPYHDQVRGMGTFWRDAER
jgi:hypothetical protein